MAPSHIEGVPPHMRNLQSRIAWLDRRDVARNPVEASNHLMFEAARRHELRADANAEERSASLPHRLLHCIDHARNAIEPAAAVRKRANARQNDMVGGKHVLRLCCD